MLHGCCLSDFGVWHRCGCDLSQLGGASGVLQGVTPLLLDLVDFEEVRCLQAKAIHPVCDRDVGYTNIDRQSGFSVAFSQRGAVVASHVTVLGELLSLPLVVLASFLKLNCENKTMCRHHTNYQ